MSWVVVVFLSLGLLLLLQAVLKSRFGLKYGLDCVGDGFDDKNEAEDCLFEDPNSDPCCFAFPLPVFDSQNLFFFLQSTTRTIKTALLTLLFPICLLLVYLPQLCKLLLSLPKSPAIQLSIFHYTPQNI
ncbi:hypothetical protein POM88_005420 [Heracleum sosnowskyi]|uniref:Uncharacterized protein n=1 Tax=Heracleum sosnowskyi TaxID=360622 RepID=A0AAD8J0Q5_9APIA|nr:hypothetical protein POM88_005420 [Heracleum sosnowskyi]